MKKTIFYLSFLSLFGAKESTAQTWEWATKLEGTLNSTDSVIIKGIDTDPSGNSYVTGYYKGQLNSSVTSNRQDGFVAKFDGSGTLQWTHKFGGPGDDAGNAISVETYGSGAFYITGYVQYNDPAAVAFNGSGGSSSMPLVTACASATAPNNVYLRGGLSSRQLFVAKYDLNGNVAWIKPVYSPSCLDGEGLGISASYRHLGGPGETNVYVTGYFEGNSISFMQSSPCTFITLTGNVGNKTAFVTKFSGNTGDAMWAKSLAVTPTVNAMSIGKNVVIDPTYGVFITGDYFSAARIGTTTISNTTGATRAYVARLNISNGGLSWITQVEASGTGADVQARDLNSNFSSSLNYLFALGDFSGTSINSGTLSASNGGGRDIYLIRMDKVTGATSILKSEGGINSQYAYGMDIDDNNAGIFISGAYDNSISFAGGPTFSYYGSTTSDHYLSKYDINLNHVCAAHWDASMNTYANTNTLDACDVAASKDFNGTAYLGGMFLNGENPLFSPISALSTSKPISGYVSHWLCCECPPPAIHVNRAGTSATITMTYFVCDNPSGIFTLTYSSPTDPLKTEIVPWGTAFVVVTGLSGSIYNWKIHNNCLITSNNVNAKTTSLGKNNESMKFEIYPNPAQRTIRVEADQEGLIEIYDVLGKLLKQTPVSSASEITIDIGEIPNGSYICKFVNKEGATFSKKIQVMH